MPFDENIECPLCMEPLDIDDMNFYPCTCGYQICRFCWHRIRTDENSLCPACRKQYQEDPAEFKPLTEEELTKIKKERRQKDVARKQKAAENRRHLANIRVVQKNLVFVVGLSTRFADTETLKRQDYFGKYGKILKVVINSSTSYAGAQGPSASAYITYTKPEDCLRAINAVNLLQVDGRTLKASLGTTKYCSHFLKGTICNKSDCMYLHELGDEEASFTKEEMQAGRHQDYEQKLVETYLTPLSNNISQVSRSTSGDSSVVNSGSKNSSTAHHRKKTDSGSSNGSSKPREPWPLLNSNRNSNQANTTQANKDSTEAVQAYTDSTDSKHNHNHVSPSPSNSSLSKMNGRSHNSPSPSCSTTSDPRTPTPEAVPSISPVPAPSIPAAEDKQSTISNTTEQIAAVASPAATSSKTMLAARKLPFSESSNTSQDSLVEGVTPQQDVAQVSRLQGEGEPVNITIQQTNPVLQPNASVPASLSGAYQDITSKPLPLVSNDMAASEWSASHDHGAAAASDDDLGFDPFFESNKGLADMLENETGRSLSPLTGYGNISLPLQHPLPRPPPGVAALPPHVQNLMSGTDMFGAGIISSVVPPSSSSIASCSAPTLPPPPPGLSTFPHYPHDTGLQQANTPLSNPSTDMPAAAYRGSRMLGLMNLGASINTNQPPASVMPHQPPINTIPRSPYNENRMGSVHPPPHNQTSFPGGFPNGMTDYNTATATFNTEELKDSLRALLPNASINFGPSAPLQHSRLKNSYMPTAPQSHNNTSSWNGSMAHGTQMVSRGGSANGVSNTVDDQFTDPAIVSGCLSSDSSNSPARAQPHWLKSIQQLTEMDSPVKQSTSQPMHSMSNNMSSLYGQPATHSRMPFSRMPFAQNIHISQPGTNGSGWPTLQAHNPPPGFPSAFRSTTQNPHIATLES